MSTFAEARALFFSCLRTYEMASRMGLPLWELGSTLDESRKIYAVQIQRLDIDLDQRVELLAEIDHAFQMLP